MGASVKILSIEAKDIYNAMNLLRGDRSYSVRTISGDLNLSKFSVVYDYSLDMIELRDIYRKKYRNNGFSFKRDKHLYSTQVINVTFNYSAKLFNTCGKNTYIRFGYDYKDCQFKDGVCVHDGELIGIQTNVEVINPLPPETLGTYFAHVDGCYKQVAPIPTVKNKAELRQYLYENGFVCEGTEYVRYKRSAGASRVGKCLFVNKVLYDDIHRWDMDGLKIKDGQEIDLSAYEAYISLPMSSIIDTIQINPENILLVDDFESVFQDEVVAVEAVDGRLVAQRKMTEVSNTIWDGESLMDISLFGKYADKGMLLLRNRFFKTCAFNTNIQEWFRDNNITDIAQLNGYTLATDISQVKLITTPSSVKYLKFGTMEQWLQNLCTTFGIVKYEKEPHFFGGRMVQCHYQLLNTLQLSYQDVETILKPSLDYIGAVRSDPAVLRYHIGYAFRADESGEEINPLKNKNDIVFKMLGINDNFTKTKIYKEFRDAIVRGFYRNLKRGHVLLNGNYSTLLGNGLELLQASIGVFDGQSVLSPGCIHSKRFGYGKPILGTRSPHVTMGNVLLARNEANEQIDKYFNMTNEIVYINSIKENVLQRLSGADMDSDTMLLTDDELLIAAARKNYDIYKVPTNLVQSKKTKRVYTARDKADLDVKTSVNKIGEIVNLSQQLNSLYWERLHNGGTFEENEELYNDICKLDVLSGIEIDKAKKEFSIDSVREIEILKRKYRLEDDGKTIKPMFFKMITTENGYELPPDTIYRYFETPMDYLQRIINSTNYRQARAYKINVIPFMDIIREPSTNVKSGYYGLIKDKIIATIKQYKMSIAQLFVNYKEKDQYGKEQIKETATRYKRECMDVIDKMSSHEYLMYIVLKEVEKKENRSIKNLMFEVLFGKPNETFMGMIEKSRAQIGVIEEDEDGEETYYSLKFKRVYNEA